MKVDNEITDKLIEENLLTKIAGKVRMMYSITNYAILCDSKIVCFCGSDIMNADNISHQLKKIFPDKTFYISEEFPSFEY